jgi:type II restriction/modification system DNA methylase subunit YeeA
MFIIDFRRGISESEASKYEAPFRHVVMIVKPQRDTSRTTVGIYWQHERARDDMRAALKPLRRFLSTVGVSKHRLFVWMTAPTLPDHAVFAFAREDDYFFGVLHSRFHEVWALKLGTRLETRPRYTPTTSFETFPFPEPTDDQKIEISTAAKELNELRENWLNPPEWTTTRVLEFPGAIDGPWSRYVVHPDARGIGTVRYPRLEPRDDDCAKKLAKRTLTNLYNERPTWLANAHAKLDSAVAHAYGFPINLTDEQILERLLALNQQRAADEKRATKKPPRVSRAKTDEELV